MSVEDYKFIPPEKPFQEPVKPLPDMPEELKEYYRKMAEKDHEVARQERKEVRSANRIGLTACLGLAAATGYVLYDANERGKGEVQATPENIYWQQIEKSSKPHGKQEENLRQRMNVLKEHFGEEAFIMLNRALGHQREPVPATPSISGFEKLCINNETAAVLFDAALYPKGTVNGNIASITYDGEFVNSLMFLDPDGKPVGPLGGVTPNGLYMQFHRMRPEASPKVDLLFIKMLSYAVSHEFGHKRDWRLDRNLTPEQRVNFLFEAYDVFLNSNDYGDPSGVMAAEQESLNKEYDGKDARTAKQRGERKAFVHLEEWWANMCSEACNYPAQFFEEASPKEIALVEKWFVRDDKDFNFFRVSHVRSERQKRLEAEYANAQAKLKLKLNRR